MRWVSGICVSAAGAALLSGCVTANEAAGLEQADRGQSPIHLLLSTPIDELETRADTERRAAAALSLAYRYGLRDVPVDTAKAEELWSKAKRAQPPMVITQYIPGVNGAPGRTVPLVIPQANPDGLMVEIAALCAKALELDPSVVASNDFGTEISGEAQYACGMVVAPSQMMQLWREARTWRAYPFPECEVDDERCVGIAQKIDRLNRRDPAQEARAAAASGDHRLGGAQYFGPLIAGWHLPGVNCAGWDRQQIRFWHLSSDYIQPGDQEHQAASEAFIAAYNRALIQSEGFPHKDICAPALQKPQPSFTGTVTNWSEFARAGSSDAPAPAGDIEAVDFLGYSAMRWATERQDSAMVMRLLQEGASTKVVSAFDLAASPLAMALEKKDNALVNSLIARGAEMRGTTKLCGVLDMDERKCRWEGLLAIADRRDLWPKVQNEGGFNAFYPEFMVALNAGNDEALRLVIPVLPEPEAAMALKQAWDKAVPEVARQLVDHNGIAGARSPTEAAMWRAASAGNNMEALAYLFREGGHLNLLPEASAARCTDAASRGDVAELQACVAEARARLIDMVADLEAGDLQAFKTAIAAVPDWKEANKLTMLARAAAKADVEAVQMLLDRGAAAQPVNFGVLQGSNDPYLMGSQEMSHSPVLAAYLRRDLAIFRILAPHATYGLDGLLQSDVLRDRIDVDLFSMSRDVSAYPSRPVERDMQVIETFVPVLSSLPNAQTVLGKLYLTATRSGYDDVMALLVANGFKVSEVENPDDVWMAWAGAGHPCKPSTGRLLLRHGLSTDYPPGEDGAFSPMRVVAHGCRNPDSLAVLVSDGGISINAIDSYGQTALDVAASQTYRPQMKAAIESLGGKSAKEADPQLTAAREQEQALTSDPDLNE